MTACHVPPPSPLMSYWITAFVPAARSALKRPAIASKVSLTVAISASSEGEQVHAPGDGEHGPGDVARPLRAEERDGVGHVLGLALALHGDALGHAVVHGAQLRIRPDDSRSDHVRRHAVARALQRDGPRE